MAPCRRSVHPRSERSGLRHRSTASPALRAARRSHAGHGHGRTAARPSGSADAAAHGAAAGLRPLIATPFALPVDQLLRLLGVLDDALRVLYELLPPAVWPRS